MCVAGCKQGNDEGGAAQRSFLNHPIRVSIISLLSSHVQRWMNVPGTRCSAREAHASTRKGAMSATVPLDMS